MSENNEVKNEEKEPKDIFIKKGFFKKLWYSITKVEKYPEMATEGVGMALKYIILLVMILSLILAIWITYDGIKVINNAADYLQNDFPDFSYQEGRLKVDSNEPVIIENNQISGKIIIDTNTDLEEEINEYTKSIGEYSNGIIVLKDKVLITNPNIKGSAISYEYNEIFKNMEIKNFSKQDIINYKNSNEIFKLYISLFIVIFIYSFVMYLMKTLWYVAIISIVGFFAAWFLKIKMRYAPVFNMSIYAITLSVLLNIIYLIINIFSDFSIKYFDVMYVSVATIYLLAAIFILKSEFIKKQAELIKIAEMQANIKKDEEEKDENKKQEEENDKDEKDKNEKDKNQKKENKDDGLEEEPEGSNA